MMKKATMSIISGGILGFVIYKLGFISGALETATNVDKELDGKLKGFDIHMIKNKVTLHFNNKESK